MSGGETSSAKRKTLSQRAAPGATVLGAAIVFLATLAVFLPIRHHGFVNWDDPGNFLQNDGFRGLGAANFHWFFTTFHMGHYQPLNWLSFAIDYALAGLDPGRFHLTQAVLHAVAAALVYSLIRALLVLDSTSNQSATRNCGGSLAVTFAASAGALFFSLHPLRVESVAWTSARTDILATIFCLAAILVYLGAFTRGGRAASGGRMAMVTVLYVCAMLCKITAVTLPAVLLLLDVYPLRRISSVRRRLDGSLALPPFAPEQRRVWIEKSPLFVLAAAGAISAFFAAGSAVSSMSEQPLARRLAVVPVSIMFYPLKTLWPRELSPLYEFPAGFGPAHRLCLLSVLALALSAAALWGCRRRAPGLVAAAAAYAIMLLPMSGLAQRGPQMAADRYSYLACIPWAVVAAWGVARVMANWRIATAFIAVGIFGALAIRTREQIGIWRDSVALWSQAIRLDPSNATAHAALGEALGDAGRLDEAIVSLRRAVAIRATQPDAHYNLALMLARRGDYREAIEQYEAELRVRPGRVEAYFGLGRAREMLEETPAAAEAYVAALGIDAGHVGANLHLAKLLVLNERFAEAEPLLVRALAGEPENTLGLHLMGDVYLATGRRESAIESLTKGVEAARRKGEAAVEQALRAKLVAIEKGGPTSTSAPSSP